MQDRTEAGYRWMFLQSGVPRVDMNKPVTPAAHLKPKLSREQIHRQETHRKRRHNIKVPRDCDPNTKRFKRRVNKTMRSAQCL